MIKDRTGLLVEEWDLQGLLQAIEMLIRNPVKREALGRAGQNFALNELGIDKKEKELERLYRSC